MGRNARMARRQRWSALTVSCLLVASFVVLGGVATADPVREARERLSEARGEAERAEARLAELEREGSLAVERYNEVRERLDQLEAATVQAIADLREIEADLAERERLAGSFVRTLYQRGSAFELAALLGSESVAEVQVRAVYLRSSAESQYALVAGLSEDRLRHAQMIADLRELRHEAEDARASLAREREAVEGGGAARGGGRGRPRCTRPGSRPPCARGRATTSPPRRTGASSRRRSGEPRRGSPARGPGRPRPRARPCRDRP
jgi:hypothetical protein